jgi:hypothetical protein
LNLRLSFAYIKQGRGVFCGLPLASFAVKGFSPLRQLSGKRVEHGNAIQSPKKIEFRRGFPEAAPTIHKGDASSIAFAFNSPSFQHQYNQPKELSGDD